MKKITSLVGAALALALTASGARAEGFAISEWSARGMALAGGMVARADDASAVAYNPAGITQIPGTTLMFGSALSMPSGSIETHAGQDVSTKAKQTYWVLPHFYLTHQMTDSLWLGVGAFPRFGLGNSFPTNWPGSTGLTDVAVTTFTVNPNLVWKVNEHVSVAAGLELTGGTMTLKQHYQAPLPDNRSKLTGTGGAVGANLALHLRFNDEWSAGLTYRSRMALNIHGKVRWNKQIGANPLYSQVHFMQNADVHGTMTLPDGLALGVAWKPRPDLSFEADVTYMTWSNYRHLNIYLENPASHVLRQDKYWRDNWGFSGSVEYKPLDWLALRAGYTYETSPQNEGYADYLVPVNGRHYFTLGAGFFWKQWTLDLAYTFIPMGDLHYDQSAARLAARKEPTVLPGRSHNVHAHNVGVSLGYTF